MSNYPKITLIKGKEVSVLRFHPWIFSGAVKKVEGEIEEGGIAEVYSADGKYLATGHFHDGSIKVRIITFEQQAIDSNFWIKKVEEAFNVRKDIGLIKNPLTNAYRLINAEGDGLPGLVIDIYSDTSIIQCHSLGMYKSADDICLALKKVYGKTLKNIYLKPEDSLIKMHPDASVKMLEGDFHQSIIAENGYKFAVDWQTGQKTGFFLDQRENRKLLQSYCKGKKVLNTFCYSGGFSVYAIGAGAKQVVSVDSSAKAIALAENNIKLNFGEDADQQCIATDVNAYFKEEGSGFDVIILDPPAFAKNVNSRHNATVGYKNLNEKAMRKIAPGGILFTFSCSAVVNRSLFEGAVMAAAIGAGRKARILHHLSQSPDHTVNIFHPEGQYLKGMVLRID